MNTLDDPKCAHCGAFLAWSAEAVTVPGNDAMVHRGCAVDWLSHIGEIRLITPANWAASQQRGSEDADVAA